MRISSIRGALRFWRRTWAWSRHNGDLSQIRKEESELVGSTNAKSGKGWFILPRFETTSPRYCKGLE
ncbi:MAG: RAMP superfamily CRISPR-associated protein [Desulfovibrio sp.]|uniref:RAMP superfamily CRISPR-associated protein n=1 Tax=Desulfovibrio sp. 7SRBS1 TaxID=3378064 RepID=UPI003B406C99